MCKFSIYTCDKFKTDLISTICVLNFQLVIPVSFTVPIFQFAFPFQFISQQISIDFMRNILSFWFAKYIDFEFIKFPIHTRIGLLVYNVLRLKTVAAIYELFVMKCSAWKSTGFSIKVKTSNGFKPVL